VAGRRPKIGNRWAQAKPGVNRSFFPPPTQSPGKNNGSLPPPGRGRRLGAIGPPGRRKQDRRGGAPSGKATQVSRSMPCSPPSRPLNLPIFVTSRQREASRLWAAQPGSPAPGGPFGFFQAIRGRSFLSSPAPACVRAARVRQSLVEVFQAAPQFSFFFGVRSGQLPEFTTRQVEAACRRRRPPGLVLDQFRPCSFSPTEQGPRGGKRSTACWKSSASPARQVSPRPDPGPETWCSDGRTAITPLDHREHRFA